MCLCCQLYLLALNSVDAEGIAKALLKVLAVPLLLVIFCFNIMFIPSVGDFVAIQLRMGGKTVTTAAFNHVVSEVLTWFHSLHSSLTCPRVPAGIVNHAAGRCCHPV